MTKTEMNRFRAILTAKLPELERFTRHRDGIAVERSADPLDEIEAASQRALAVCNLDREFNQLRTLARPSVVSKKATSGPAGSAMKTSIPSGLPRCHGLHSAYGARKPCIVEEIQAPSGDLLGRAA